jgi:uncharacterized protein (DUF58 family)
MKRFKTILFFMFLTSVLALGSGLPVYYRVSFFAFLLLGVTFIWNHLNLFRIVVNGRRDLSKTEVGKNIESEIVVENLSPLPKFNLEVSDLIELPGSNIGAVFNLMPFARRKINLNIPIKKRGIYEVCQPSVVSEDPLGIFKINRKHKSRERLVVFPSVVDLTPFLLARGDVNGEGGNFMGANSSVSSVSTIREYQAGDSAKRIHWPTTVRKNELMVKQFEPDSEDVTWVLLDLDSQCKVGDDINNTEEYSVMIGASLMKTYSKVNRSIGLITGDDNKYVLRDSESNRDPESILFELTKLSGSGSISLINLFDYFRSEVSLVNVSLIIITSSNNSRWIESISSSRFQGCSPVVIFVDPISFGSVLDVRPLANQLAVKGIPVYMTKYGDDLSESLSQMWMVNSKESISAKEDL